MNDNRYIKKLINISKSYQVDKYRELDINNSHRPFEGTPKKHPNDEKVLILITNALSNLNEFYEFSLDSIGHVEDLGTVTSESGQSITKIRVWVKRGMPAIKSTPFIVK